MGNTQSSDVSFNSYNAPYRARNMRYQDNLSETTIINLPTHHANASEINFPYTRYESNVSTVSKSLPETNYALMDGVFFPDEFRKTHNTALPFQPISHAHTPLAGPSQVPNTALQFPQINKALPPINPEPTTITCSNIHIPPSLSTYNPIPYGRDSSPTISEETAEVERLSQSYQSKLLDQDTKDALALQLTEIEILEDELVKKAILESEAEFARQQQSRGQLVDEIDDFIELDNDSNNFVRPHNKPTVRHNTRPFFVDETDDFIPLDSDADEFVGLRGKTTVRRITRTTTRITTPMFTCSICLDVKNKYEGISIDPCNHLYCFDCFHGHVNSSLNSMSFPIPCPECRNEIGQDQVSMVCDESDWQKYLRLSLIKGTVGVMGIVQCPGVDCEFLLELDPEHDGFCECLSCGLKWCVKCDKHTWHEGKTCEEYRIELHELDPETNRMNILFRDLMAENHRILCCPNCRCPIEKDGDDCNHMHCSRCDYHFCCLCGEIIGTPNEERENIYSHFGIEDTPCFGNLYLDPNEFDPTQPTGRRAIRQA